MLLAWSDLAEAPFQISVVMLAFSGFTNSNLQLLAPYCAANIEIKLH